MKVESTFSSSILSAVHFFSCLDSYGLRTKKNEKRDGGNQGTDRSHQNMIVKNEGRMERGGKDQKGWRSCREEEGIRKDGKMREETAH